ncbi:hypothetical protein J542_3032 [Acinetobacter baumannii 299505]|nr:hypothetical protein J542_3032 [Acinetobacter baumannii 299505]EXR78808.1 hypothetical protein J685_3293 [Acinetobacter baumannii 541915]
MERSFHNDDFSSHGEQMPSHPDLIKQAYSDTEQSKYAASEFESKAL